MSDMFSCTDLSDEGYQDRYAEAMAAAMDRQQEVLGPARQAFRAAERQAAQASREIMTAARRELRRAEAEAKQAFDAAFRAAMEVT